MKEFILFCVYQRCITLRETKKIKRMKGKLGQQQMGIIILIDCLVRQTFESLKSENAFSLPSSCWWFRHRILGWKSFSLRILKKLLHFLLCLMLLQSAVIMILDLLGFTWLFFPPLWKLLERQWLFTAIMFQCCALEWVFLKLITAST